MTFELLAASGGGTSFLLIIVVVFVLMYLFMIRPQRARQRAQQQALRDVGPGTEIVTSGGLIGTVTAVADDELTLEIAPETYVRCARRAVASILTPRNEEEETLEEAYEEGDESDDEAEAEPEAAERNRR